MEERLVALGEHRHDGNARDAVLSRVDSLLPSASLSTTEWAETEPRKVIGPTGEEVAWRRELTPYIPGIQDACDLAGVKCVAVSGNARSTKTTAFENRVMKMWSRGPVTNLLWLMQSDEALTDYIDERGEWMLLNHEKVAEKIDWTERRNSRTRKRIGKSLALWRVATKRLLVAKAAPMIVADEIDSYAKAVRKALRTLIRNRQREYGSGSLAMVCSHPDAGPNDGINLFLSDSLLHLWMWRCPSCGGRSTPSEKAASVGFPRMTWNVPELLGMADRMERKDLLDMIEREAVLICPHDGCGYEISDDDERRKMSATGCWVQPHQHFDENDRLVGDAKIASTMGFVIHAFQTPFISLGEVAREWASAKLTFDTTGDDTDLREATSKTLGETYEGASEETKVDDWKTVKARLTSRYERRTVPSLWDEAKRRVLDGPLFLTAFVDVQGNRFEVRVIGWDLAKRSWLIDAYAVKQWPGFENIDPANRIRDWDILEPAVITQVYPLADNEARKKRGEPELFMPIAKVAIDAAGEPGVANNARRWLSNLLGRQLRGETPIIEGWRVQLVHGSRHKTGELYGRPRPIDKDDAGRFLEPKVFERDPNVHDVKKIIAKRMRIQEEGVPGRMHLPFRLPDNYVRELVSEKLLNDEWVRSGRNETWDGWVMCEVARALLQPDRVGLWDETPIWARPAPAGEGIDDRDRNRVSYFERLAALNRGE